MRRHMSSESQVFALTKASCDQFDPSLYFRAAPKVGLSRVSSDNPPAYHERIEER